jgi:hypothetical protein
MWPPGGHAVAAGGFWLPVKAGEVDGRLRALRRRAQRKRRPSSPTTTTTSTCLISHSKRAAAVSWAAPTAAIRHGANRTGEY